jgi:hypothetical protein
MYQMPRFGYTLASLASSPFPVVLLLESMVNPIEVNPFFG